MENKGKKVSKGGRKPKLNKAEFRYSVNFTEEENAKFLAMFRKSKL